MSHDARSSSKNSFLARISVLYIISAIVFLRRKERASQNAPNSCEALVEVRERVLPFSESKRSCSRLIAEATLREGLIIRGDFRYRILAWTTQMVACDRQSFAQGYFYRAV